MTTTDDREQLRKECHEDLAVLRTDDTIPERAYRLLEKLVARLDRIETGSFEPTETPTTPERRSSSAKWRNDEVLRALDEGKKKDEA